MMLKTYGIELWNYLVLSAPYFLLGLFASAFIHYFLRNDLIKKMLGGKTVGNVVKAAAVGVPLPLCSCSVIPAAVTLKKNGASTAATSSFLISTPESGVDSIAMTYALIGLPMAIIRPIAAFATAFVAGVAQLVFKTDDDAPQIEQEKKPCCKKNKAAEEKPSLKKSFKYAFVDLLDDMSGWLAFGLLLGAGLNMAVPDNFFQGLGSGTSMLVMLGIGIPFYICASASTPIAASLIMKGMAPGSALIFLLVGPATNLSNIMIIQKYIGKKALMINIGAIIIVSVVFGVLVNMYMPTMDIMMKGHHHEHTAWWQTALAVIFSVMMVVTLVNKYIINRNQHNHDHDHGAEHAH
jgi:uncharacterized membrane protein YraQ (UPF0718 family)